MLVITIPRKMDIPISARSVDVDVLEEHRVGARLQQLSGWDENKINSIKIIEQIIKQNIISMLPNDFLQTSNRID